MCVRDGMRSVVYCIRMRGLRNIGVALIIAHAAVAAVRAQVPPEHGVVLAERMDLARLVDLAAARLGVSIEYDPGVFGNAAALRLPAMVSDEELWPLVNRLLASRGLTTVQLPGSAVFSVMKVTDAAAHSSVRDGLAGAPAPGYQSLVVSPRYRTARDAAEAIRPLLSRPGGSVVEAAGLLIVSDLTPRLEEIVRVVERIDAPAAAAAITEVPIERTSAKAIIELAGAVARAREGATGQRAGGELIAAPGGGSVLVVGTEDQARYWRGLLEGLDRAEAVEERRYAVPAGMEGRLAGVVRSGTGAEVEAGDSVLVVGAVPSVHARVEGLLARAAGSGEVSIRVVPVKNRRVADLARRLGEMVSGGRGWEDGAADGGRDGVVDGLGAPAAGALAGASAGGLGGGGGGGVRITADEASNVLILVGEAGALDRVEAILPLLDVRQPQVMLEVMLVSLSEGDSTALGVELERIGDVGGATYRIASLFGLSAAGAAGRVVGDAAGLTGAVLDPGEFSVVVRALQSVARGRSVSMPRVLVTNNELATFSSVVQQPILETVRGDSSTSTSFGGTQDAGTTISVKPQIARSDYLLLTYQVSLSSFVGTAAAAGLPPPRQQNRVDSIAMVPDGHTVVVGGLELTTESRDAGQVPLIAEVPLIGELFRNRAVSSTRSRFFVLIRANILRSGGFADLARMSEGTIDATGVGDGFPVTEARVIR